MYRAVGESLSNLVDVCTSPVSKEKRYNTEKTFRVQEYSKSFNDTGFIDQTNSTRNLSSLGIQILITYYIYIFFFCWINCGVPSHISHKQYQFYLYTDENFVSYNFLR